MPATETILVIDDDAHIRRVLEVKLKNRGYRVITVKNGEQGLNRIIEHHPLVVISDINMPKIDGKRLCRITNELKRDKSFLTIVITARIAHDDKDWAEDMIDTLFLEKPFSPMKIMDYIEAYCRA